MTRIEGRLIRMTGLAVVAILMVGGLPIRRPAGLPSDLFVSTAAEFPAAVLSDAREFNLLPSAYPEGLVIVFHRPRDFRAAGPTPALDRSARAFDYRTGPALRAPPDFS